MADENNQSLLDLLREVSKLPAYLQADAVKNIVTEWRRTNSLIDDVASGRTSFERAISAFIDENRRLTYLNKNNACNTPEFAAMAQEVEKKFSRILPLVSLITVNRAPVMLDLVSPVDFRRMLWRSVQFFIFVGIMVGMLMWCMSSFMDGELKSWWHLAIIGGAGFGLLMIALNLLFSYPIYLSDRRRLAEVTLWRARFLDSMFKLQRA